MVADIRAQAQRRDRWVSWIVIAVFIVSLLLGLVIKAVAQSPAETYDGGTFRVRYPAGWTKLTADAPVVLEVADRVAGLRTTLTLERRAGTDAQGALGTIQTGLETSRKRTLNSYVRLSADTEARIGIYDQAIHVTFAYVDFDPNKQTAPVVIRGEDYLIAIGGEVYIFTVTTPETDYAQAQRYLKDFVRSFQK